MKFRLPLTREAESELARERHADHFHDECGVFGIHGHDEAAHITYLGLYALQHRGQESCGIVASNGREHTAHRAMGLVADTFGEKAFDYVFCSRVLVQIPHFENALEQLFKVARKAVFSIISIDGTAKLERIRRTNVDTGASEIVYFRYFTYAELNAASDAVGARDFRLIQGPRPYASYAIWH